MKKLLPLLLVIPFVITGCGGSEDSNHEACVKALDLADEGFSIAGDGFTAVADGDASALQDAATRIQDLAPRYNAAEADCRG